MINHFVCLLIIAYSYTDGNSNEFWARSFWEILEIGAYFTSGSSYLNEKEFELWDWN